ncbi:MAG TPA: hypothetical protein VJZ77_05010 [Blastocatellia bacterium]|nr:hypothetical protein [Blastocatellia bacterium]
MKELIDIVNKIDRISDEDWKEFEYNNPFDAHADKNFCKGIHQMAQLANLPVNMWGDYARALGGSTEEWERFCQSLPAKLWRKWPEQHDREWRWPLVTYELMIDADGLIKPHYHNSLSALENIEARRLRECRYCQRIFWASRIVMVQCSKRCGNNFRQKECREKKKRDAKAGTRRK